MSYERGAPVLLSLSYCAPLHASGYEGETWPNLRYNLLRLLIFHFPGFQEMLFVAHCLGKLVAARGDLTMEAFVVFFFFFFTLVTGPLRSLSLELSDTRVYEPQIRARLGTTAHFCKVVVRRAT